MGNEQKESFNQYQYLIDFDYNESHHRGRLILSDRLLEETDKFLLIAFAFNAAESLLKKEKQLVPEGKISHIRIYDVEGNLLANQD